MNERIQKLTELTLQKKMLPEPVKTEYDRLDLLLPRIEMETKRICEYILNQQPLITEYSTMTGFLVFDGSVVGTAHSVSGHVWVKKVMDEFYLKPVDNISTMEWQHASGDYRKVLAGGIRGLVREIDDSMKAHEKEEELAFLQGLRRIALAIIEWTHKCGREATLMAENTSNPEYRENLLHLAKALERTPENAHSSFYEALLCMYICFSFAPDSFGTLDRYLEEFYERDIKAGILTREKAKEYLQEFLLEAQAKNSKGWATRGAESHFCVGGYRLDGSDGFGEISHLIVESLMELPIYIPEITFRWTAKTPRETLRFIMDCERKDKFKRISFTNDEKRLKCLTELCGIPYEKAIHYTMVGCNELAFPGSYCASTSKGNMLRCVDTLFHRKSEEIAGLEDFDRFYEVFERELYSDFDIIYGYDDKYNLARSRDISYVSSLFMNDCIENAKSLTQGGGNTAVSSPMLLGAVNVIDSLVTVKQFVFEEKVFSMRQLIEAVQADWEGYEDLRTLILRKGSFFGNNDILSNSVAQRLYQSIYRYLKGKRNVFGYPIVLGDITGYNEHFKWFGSMTKATPDGRHSGDFLKFGLSQNEGRDRNGLTSLLAAVAAADPNAICCGATVTNVSLDETLVKNDESFEKLVDLFEGYFRSGGVQFQLNYVSREELLAAKENPEKYGNLRVRVTGFSEYFVRLNSGLQEDIIKRTKQA